MIKPFKTEFSSMPRSINNHTMKYFTWKSATYCIDKETDTGAFPYRLYQVGSGMLLDYFGDGKTWKECLLFVEGWMTAKFGENK